MRCAHSELRSAHLLKTSALQSSLIFVKFSSCEPIDECKSDDKIILYAERPTLFTVIPKIVRAKCQRTHIKLNLYVAVGDIERQTLLLLAFFQNFQNHCRFCGGGRFTKVL